MSRSGTWPSASATPCSAWSESAGPALSGQRGLSTRRRGGEFFAFDADAFNIFEHPQARRRVQ